MADFATTDDVGDRLLRELTDAEQTAVAGVLSTVADLIRDEAGRDLDWDPDPVPGYLRELSIQKAIAAISNPSNLAAESSTLGAYATSRTYQRAQDGGITLTDAEGRGVRFAVYGSTSGSASQESMIDREIDLIEGRDVDVDPVA